MRLHRLLCFAVRVCKSANPALAWHGITVRRPGFREGFSFGSSLRIGLGLSVVDGFVLGGRNAADVDMQPLVVEPVHVLSGGQLDVGQSLPRQSFVISSVLYRPIADSISALSRASPAVPIEASIPASIRCALNTKLVYCPDLVDRRVGSM